MKNNNGFTLIEIIVVLLILSVLSAIAVPSLTGFIGDATKRTIISECRSCVMASTAISAERFGSGDIVSNENCMEPGFVNKILAYAETPADGTIDNMKFNNSSLSELYYTRDNITVKYENRKYTFVDGADTGDSGTGGNNPVIVIPDIDNPGGSSGDTDEKEYSFTNLVGFVGNEEAKEAAIKENAKALVSLFNKYMIVALHDASPDVAAVYWNKEKYSLGSSMTGCTLFDGDAKQIGAGSSFTVDPVTPMKAVLADYDNAQITYTEMWFDLYSTVPKRYYTIPYKVHLKSEVLVGNASDFYTYYPDSGLLVKGKV